MRTLQHSQPQPCFSPPHNKTQAFRPPPKPDPLKIDVLQWAKPALKAGGSVKFSGWYHPAMSLNQVATACSQSSIEDTDFLGKTALLLATQENKPEVVKLLLEKNANINHQNQEKRTALMEASRKGHGNLIQLLLAHGADPALRDSGNRNAQDLAANRGIKKQIQNFRAGTINAPQQRGGWIKKGAIGLLLATAGKPVLEYGYDQATGTTPLMKVAKSSGSLKEAKSLINQKKINPAQKDIWGYTAQHYAEQAWNMQLASYLERVHIEMIDEMTQAATSNQKDKVHRLLTQGIDINAKDSNGNTALINAANAGHRKLVDFLLEQGAHLRIRNRDGKIAIDYTKEGSSVHTALKTEQRKRDRELQQAINHMNVDGIKIAIGRGANPDAGYQNGMTHLMTAAQSGNTKILQALIDSGANVDLANQDGYTALMFAAMNGQTEAIITLLDGGADPCQKTGNTLSSSNAYDLAKKFKHKEATELLYEVNKEENCYNPFRFIKEIIYSVIEYTPTVVQIYHRAGQAP